tara:strand:+ start:1487 stop:1786 length:300 start_codon:yes stop_codon:yes gene_type:complete
MAAGSGMSRLKDIESGHQCWPPVAVVTGSTNVFVNSIAAIKVGDKTSVHVCGNNPPHPDTCSKGSVTVKVNRKDAMRIGDLLSGGGVMTQGSHTVLAGA